MPFPAVDRVVYENNPLTEVVCQVRFPPILRIDTELPAGFQEQIRTDYPNYEQSTPFRLPAKMPPELAQLVAAELPLGGQKAYQFASRDGVWTLSLTREFLALTCTRYDSWHSFRDRLRAGVDALSRHYNPAFYTRLGLRYQDVIHRSKLGLGETPWDQLLRPAVAGVWGAPEVADDVEALEAAAVLNLPDGIGQSRFRFGLGIDKETQEKVFVIDGDFFTDQQMEPAHAFERLDAFNRQARHFFRWCITDTLHRAMRPQPAPHG